MNFEKNNADSKKDQQKPVTGSDSASAERAKPRGKTFERRGYEKSKGAVK